MTKSRAVSDTITTDQPCTKMTKSRAVSNTITIPSPMISENVNKRAEEAVRAKKLPNKF